MKRFRGVFPAHAGMSRGFEDDRAAYCSFPRTRGDEPQIANAIPGGAGFSPHTRG